MQLLNFFPLLINTHIIDQWYNHVVLIVFFITLLLALIVLIYFAIRWQLNKAHSRRVLEDNEKMYRNAIAVAGAVPYYQNYLTNQYDFVHEDIEKLLGFKPHEFSPDIWEDLLYETVLLGDLKGLPIEDAVEKARGLEGVSWRADYHLRTKQNEEKWVSNSAVQVRDKNGNVIGSIGILQDITERKKLEFQLYQTQKYEALGQLSGGIAHNINNLLTSILGNLALAKSQANPEILPFLNSVTLASNRAADMVKDLQTFSRNMPNKISDIDINEIITEVYNLIHTTFSKTITITKSLQEPLPCIHADSAQIYSMIMNLCINARDAIERVKLEETYNDRQADEFFIHLATEIIEFNHVYQAPNTINQIGTYLCFSIQDNGTGISPEVQQHIFEPFYTTKNTVGTGLGLSSVYGIVEQHQGCIDFKTIPGKGTTFFVYFPIKDKKPSSEKSRS